MPVTHDGMRRIHRGLSDAVCAGDGLERLATLAARELDGALAIVLPAIDRSVIEPRGDERLATLRRYVRDGLHGRVTAPPDGLLNEVTVTSGDERLGSVVLLGERAQPAADTILRLTALATATAVTLEQGASDAEVRARAALLELLCGPEPPPPGETVARARRLGCELAGGASALCARVDGASATWTLAIVAQEFPAALAVRRGEHVAALLPTAGGDALRLARRLCARVPVGLSPLEPDVASLGAALRYAELAMAVAAADDVAPDALLSGSWRVLLRIAAGDEREIDALVDTTVGPAVDPLHNARADLLQTLRAYLDHGARIAPAAAALHAHRHTIAYRLSRIAELTGHDPQTAHGQAQLSLGLQALAIRAALRGPLA